MATLAAVECPRCGKQVRAYVPRHGDGSALVTCWHKDPGDRSKWCRAEVDPLDYDDAGRYLYRRDRALGYTVAAGEIARGAARATE